jgi:hypothetical protein
VAPLVVLCDVRLDQRLYFSEKSKSRSRLRGINACLRAEVPVWPVRALGERAEVFLPDHCQVGFAVIFIIDGISFFCSGMNKPEACRELRALVGVNRQNYICQKSQSIQRRVG